MEAAADRIAALQTTDAEAGAERDVAALLAQLPDRYRQVITLFYLEQKAYEEVAVMLGIPLGTVKTLIFRAKKELLRIGTRDARDFSSEPRTSITKSAPCLAVSAVSARIGLQALPTLRLM